VRNEDYVCLRCRRENNNKIDLRRIEYAGMNWIHLPQDRVQWRVLANTARNLGVP
jgi:hypothetical protein